MVAMKVRRKSFVFIGLLLFAPILLAHRMPEGLTTIERNPNTDTIEITHRFHLHDAEEAMQVILSDGNLTLESIEGRAKLALHVETDFQIADGESDAPISLLLVGAQIEGDQILVFQEYTGKFPTAIKVRHDAFRDAFPQQANTLNFKLDSRIRTLVFRDANKWKILKR